MTTENNKAIEEAQIRQRIESWARAIRAKDVDAVMSMYAPGIVSFDVEPPLQYVGTKAWPEVFASFEGPIGYEIRGLSVTTGDDVAFSHSLNRLSGTTKNGPKTGSWVRWTGCFRKIDGQWLITHDHASVPVDAAGGKALLDLEP
jgi:ketosteroid isomerase-like protein